MSSADLLTKVTPGSRAIIIQNTFGLPANIEDILSIAKKNKLVVIEDVAHALGAEYKNQKVGTFGDAAFYSFGRFKIISAVYGGAAATNNPEIAKNLEKFYNECDWSSYFWIFQELFHPVFLSVMKPLYNIFSLGKVGVVIAKKLRLISLTVYSEEKSGGRPGFGPSRLPNALELLGLKQLRKLRQFNKHRQALAAIYQNELGFLERVKLPRILPEVQPVFLYFPIQLENSEATYELIGLGRRKEGIYLENWPAKKVIGPQGTDLEKLQYQVGSCPNAEEAAARIVVLPTNPNTREKDALRVVNLIRKFLAK